MAESLGVSAHTVKTHIYNLFKKLGASNRVQATTWAKTHASELLL
ncbi:MAG: response regulator transcription factor [Oceanobacter sp.]